MALPPKVRLYRTTCAQSPKDRSSGMVRKSEPKPKKCTRHPVSACTRRCMQTTAQVPSSISKQLRGNALGQLSGRSLKYEERKPESRTRTWQDSHLALTNSTICLQRQPPSQATQPYNSLAPQYRQKTSFCPAARPHAWHARLGACFALCASGFAEPTTFVS